MGKKHNQGKSFRINIASYITHKSNSNHFLSIYFFFLAIHTSELNIFVQITSIKFHRTLYKSLKILCFLNFFTPLRHSVAHFKITYVQIGTDYSSIVPREPSIAARLKKFTPSALNDPFFVILTPAHCHTQREGRSPDEGWVGSKGFPN